MKTEGRRMLFLLAAAGALRCGGETPPAEPRTAALGGQVVATVNGTALTELDLLQKLKNDSHKSEMKPEYRKNVLEALIRDQLVYQRAMDLGLDTDPAYQGPVRQMEAQLAELKRSKAAEVFFRHEVAGRVEVTEVDARQYFDDNAERLQTESHVFQIFRRSRAAIDQVKQEIDGGKTFEEVAREGFPGLESQTPWDLGYLKSAQAPEAWRSKLPDMKPGEVSGILAGPQDRFWMIKLIDRRRSAATFDEQKPALMEVLKNERIMHLRERTESQLREAGKIVYANP